MAPPRAPSRYALLTRLFLRQFLENDLISPDADRSQLLAVVGAMVMCLTLFISMFLSARYLGAGLSPGEAAMFALNDKFFYLGIAMIATALVAVSQWDALAIDPRDAAILEPLPVDPGTIRRAKLSAIAILGGAVACGISFFPSLVFPWLLSLNLPQMPAISLFRLAATHALMSLSAAAFGYLSIIALRETLAAVLGRRWFTVASPWVQGVLIVTVGSSLLLLPVVSSRVAEQGFEDWRAATPPMWFVGAYEMSAGGLIADLPRPEMRGRQAARDAAAAESYRGRRALFPGLARQAAIAGLATLFLAVAAYAWNARRVSALAPAPPPSFRRRWQIGERLANALLVRDRSAQAGFYFALAVFWRSNTHRLTLACAAAAGFAMALVALTGADPAENGVTARLLAMQPLLYGALLVGFRHVIRVPAELRASWGFQLAWSGHERAFLAGVTRAAILALAVPAIAVLLPFYTFVLGAPAALGHAALGLLGAIVLLEVLLVTYDKVPFTCTYLPTENMKALGPIYVLLFFIGAANFARMQFEAWQSGNPVSLLLTLAIVFAVARLMSNKRPRLTRIEFDEAPATYQRLGLQ
jgi:hypothetical protein